jgi:hypothetical protein
MCSRDTRQPTGLAQVEGESPRGRAPAASSSFPHLSSSTGSLPSCRRRGSTGIAITGCSPRITSSGPPSRRMTKGNVGKPRDAATGGRAFGGHAARGDATADCCDSCDKPPSHDTSRRQRPNSWRGWGRSFLLRARGVVATSASSRSLPIRGRSGRSWHISANRSNHRPSHRPVARRPTGESSCRATFDRAIFQATDRRAARHRYPQPLTAFHGENLRTCIETCRTCVALLECDSAMAEEMCEVCEEACEQCAAECTKCGDEPCCKACAAACKKCHDACRAMRR